MKTKLLLTLLLASSAFAESLPPGCYVDEATMADSQYCLSPCWSPKDGRVTYDPSPILENGNPFPAGAYYGEAVSSLMQQKCPNLGTNEFKFRLIRKLKAKCGKRCLNVK